MVKVKREGLILSLNWDELVLKPAKQGMFKEAFSAADSLIDSTIEYLLRRIYHEHTCQDLISEIHHLRGRVNFDGMILLEILKSKTIVDEHLLQRVRQFKKARDLVLHENRSHYALITFGELEKIKTQGEYDKFAENKANLWLNEASKIDNEIVMKFQEIQEKGKEYYFSSEFYNEHPRSAINEQKYPKIIKKSKKTPQNNPKPMILFNKP